MVYRTKGKDEKEELDCSKHADYKEGSLVDLAGGAKGYLGRVC